MKIKTISVRELLEQTMSGLEQRLNPRKIILQEGVLTEIANDSDWHRTREGYMQYNSAALYSINDKTIMFALGTACGGYPADPYDSDIMAFEFETNSKSAKCISEELKKKIRKSTYFQNSILIGLSDGRLDSSKSQNQLMLNFWALIGKRIPKFTAKPMKTDRNLINPSTMSYLVTSSVKYNLDFPKFLVDSFEKTLQELK
jgi:hypothetical protein